ncbi:hypothetical protein I4U23_026320 [Adineta vaga]|nr:hypothetical protein I4U23_026320 [Adineta vaga]
MGYFVFFFLLYDFKALAMAEQQANHDIEIVGMGVQSTTPIKASPDRVWAAMLDKMYHTEKYLPVSNVKITDEIPDKGFHREMTFHGKVLRENIYLDKSRFEVRCDVIDEDVVHMNVYHPDTGLLEYWEENKNGERVSWRAPKNVVLAAMEKTKQFAEADE